MSVIDEVLAANEIYSRTHELRKLTPRPERKLAVLTCMDTRLSIRTLGLKTGDAHIIRNAGGIVTEDTLRSLVVSHYLLGTEEIMVINHTDCGLMLTSEQDLRTRIQNRTGTAAVTPAFFYAFQNIDENVRHQLQKLRTHPWIPHSVAAASNEHRGGEAEGPFLHSLPYPITSLLRCFVTSPLPTTHDSLSSCTLNACSMKKTFNEKPTPRSRNSSAACSPPAMSMVSTSKANPENSKLSLRNPRRPSS